MKILLLLLVVNCAGYQIKEFETTQGKIIQSEVVKEFENRAAYLGRDDFKAVVKYSFNLEGVEYISDSISPKFINRFNSKKKAEKVVLRYKIGEVVKVFYRKSNPKSSFLEIEFEEEEEEDDSKKN
jgi:hypothetical protein